MDATGFKPNCTSKGPDEMASMVNQANLRSYRFDQMCEDYDDPDFAKRLLEEKEKDLELAARIGKALLQRNDDLQRKNEMLEEQMGRVGDQVTQLKHELQRKSDLLRVFTEDSGDAGDFKKTSDRTSCGNLQRRVRLLEDENSVLKVDITQLKAMTIVLKEKEDQIVAEFLRKLAEAKRHEKAICTDLQDKEEECHAKEHKIRTLTKEIAEKAKSEQNVREENGLLAAKLRVVQGLQEDLAHELKDLQERYAEVVSMLVSAKQELKDAQERQTRFSTSSMADDSQYDSLASELEASDSGYSFNSKINQPPNASPVCFPDRYDKDLKETIDQVAMEIKPQLAIEDQMPSEEVFDPVELDSGASERAKGIIRSIEAALEMPLYSKGPTCRYANRLGVPGTPGSKDLEFAIERLSHKPGMENPQGDHGDDSAQVKLRKSVEPKKSASNRAKLMLVVPVEGSRALAHWKQLATPSGIDPRSWEKLPGINVKSSFGISNSPNIPPPRKQLAVSSIFLNANLPIPASARPKSEIFDPSVSATFPLLASHSTTQIEHSAVTGDIHGHQTKFGPSLTEKCVGFLSSIGGSWLTSGNDASVEKSRSTTAVFSGTGQKTRMEDRSDFVDGHGVLDSLCGQGGEGVVMRSGIRKPMK